LEDVVRLRQITQAVRAEMSEDHVSGQVITDQSMHSLGKEDLAAMADLQQSRQSRQRSAQVIACSHFSRVGVEGHAGHESANRFGPTLSCQCLLSGEGGCEGRGG
jgi:hypothetical protein